MFWYLTLAGPTWWSLFVHLVLGVQRFTDIIGQIGFVNGNGAAGLVADGDEGGLPENLFDVLAEIADAALSAVVPDQLVEAVVRDGDLAFVDAEACYFGNLKRNDRDHQQASSVTLKVRSSGHKQKIRKTILVRD